MQRRNQISQETKFELRYISKQWEGLRIVYNVILLIEGLLLPSPCIGFLGIFIFGLFANICYCLGPFTEFYLLAFGFQFGNLRYALFTVGLLFSMLVTLSTAIGIIAFCSV